MDPEKFHLWMKYLILIATPIVIVTTLLVVIPFIELTIPDYIAYEHLWDAFLTGKNPYIEFWVIYDGSPVEINCAYPLGFFSLGPFYALHPLFPKVIFCLSWLATGIIMDNICIKYKVSNRATLLYVMGFIILNPIYVSATVILGRYDAIVGVFVLLAVYCIEHADQIKSGIYAALAFLFKFVGLILLFPIVVAKKKINWKLGGIALLICGGTYLIGYAFWGSPVFGPFIEHLTREPKSSIFVFIKDLLGIDLAPYIPYALIAGAVLAAILLYILNDDISTYSLLIIFFFILILPVFYAHYVLWFFPLITYWGITHKDALKGLFVIYISGLLVFSLTDILPKNIMALLSAVVVLILILFVFLNRKKTEEGKKDQQSDESQATNETP